MEKLMSLVPADLRRAIAESGPEDLDYTCGSLLDFFLPSSQFQRVARELTDPELGLCKKNREAALDLKQKGNGCFVGGDFGKALSFYSQALRFAPMSSNDADKNLLATLYVNRASSMHNLGLVEECKQDCDRALLLAPNYVKAWYRRGKANISLKNYEDAVHDLEVALRMESSTSSKNHIKGDLEMVLGYFKSTAGASNLSSVNMNENMGSYSYLRYCCTFDAYPSIKEPVMIDLGIMVILKNCRETHCHFCLKELSAGVIFCPSCAIPLYCCQQCQGQAIEGQSEGTTKGIPEHRHECGGVNWPAVLPSDVVLLGRIVARFIEERRHCPKNCRQKEILAVISRFYSSLCPHASREQIGIAYFFNCTLLLSQLLFWVRFPIHWSFGSTVGHSFISNEGQFHGNRTYELSAAIQKCLHNGKCFNIQYRTAQSGASNLFLRQTVQSFMQAQRPCLFSLPQTSSTFNRVCAIRIPSGVILWPPGWTMGLS